MIGSPGTDIRTITSNLGFGPYSFVRDRISVADLFRPGDRCGLYALHFANGDGYVGKTIDVVRRFAGHRQNHDDIVEIAFRLVPAQDQDREERAAITRCEAAGVRLRNIQFMSIVLGDADLDTVVSQETQAEWLRSLHRTTTFKERPDDLALRRRYETRFAQLKNRRQWPLLQPVLQEYAATCLPAPDRTELSFWSITCLAARSFEGQRLLARLNIFWQEVMTVGLDTAMGKLWYTFHVRQSVLQRAGFRVPVFARLHEHRYDPGGQDQVQVIANDDHAGDTLRLLADPAFVAAAKDFNLNLMRKGANNFARFHCFALADHMLRPQYSPLIPAYASRLNRQ